MQAFRVRRGRAGGERRTERRVLEVKFSYGVLDLYQNNDVSGAAPSPTPTTPGRAMPS